MHPRTRPKKSSLSSICNPRKILQFSSNQHKFYLLHVNLLRRSAGCKRRKFTVTTISVKIIVKRVDVDRRHARSFGGCFYCLCHTHTPKFAVIKLIIISHNKNMRKVDDKRKRKKAKRPISTWFCSIISSCWHLRSYGGSLEWNFLCWRELRSIFVNF